MCQFLVEDTTRILKGKVFNSIQKQVDADVGAITKSDANSNTNVNAKPCFPKILILKQKMSMTIIYINMEMLEKKLKFYLF